MITSIDFLAALSIGLLGGFHCIGMCGPIVLALPYRQKETSYQVGSILLYNIGRILTYSMLGIIFGLFGKGLALAGVQRWVSVILGVLMILSVLAPVLFKKVAFIDRFYYRLTQKLKILLAPMLRGKRIVSFLGVGLINGLLPCGLVYVALAGAIASGNAISGSFFMLLFGIGTIPLMFLFAFVTGKVSIRLRNQIRKAIPIFIVLLGIIFILRGANLGIPYLSPMLQGFGETSQGCCH